MRSPKQVILVCIASVWLLSGISQARGGFLTDLTVVTMPEPGGLTLYNYTLTNQQNSTINDEVFVLQISPESNLQSITSPSNWDLVYDVGASQVVWGSPDPSSDLLPGSSLTFSFLSALPPVSQTFQVFGADDTGTVFDENDGQIASPGIVASSTPEPTSMIPFGIGMLTLAGYTLYHQSRRQ